MPSPNHLPVRLCRLYLACWVFALVLGCLLYPDPAQAAVFDTYPIQGGTCDVKDSIVIYFDEEINASDFNNNYIRLYDGTGVAVSLNKFQYQVVGGKTTLIVDPINNLSYNTKYTLYLWDLRDLHSANRISYTLYFSTIDYPDRLKVMDADPVRGKVNVPVTTNIKLTFNKCIDLASVDNNTVFLTDTSTGNIVPTQLELDNSGGVAVLTIKHKDSLAYRTTYRLTIQNNGAYALRDLDGQTMAADTLEFSTQPSTTPAIINYIPYPSSSNVAINTLISVAFNEDMDAATLNNTNIMLLKNNNVVQLQPITYQPNTFTINLIPFTALDPGTKYIVQLSSSIKDVNGNPLTAATWDFTTAGTASSPLPPSSNSPVITSRDPASGATGVSVNKDISFQFNNGMDSTTINSSTVTLSLNGSQVPFSFIYNSGSQVTIRPANSLLNNSTYTVNLSGAIKDIYGNYLAPTSWSFSTSYTSGYYPGSGSAYPAPGSSGVPLDTEISYQFGARMNSSTINSSNVYLSYSGGGRVSCSIDYDSSNYRVTLRPYSNLSAYTTYTVNLSGVQDYYGSYIAPVTWNFTTGNRYDYNDYYYNRYYNNDYRAGVYARSPEASASDVALDKTITFRFDKTMRSSTIDSSSIYLTRNGSRVAATVSYNSSSSTVTLYPNSNLQPNSEYTVWVSGDVRDYDGYSLGSTSWTFRTRGTQTGSGSSASPGNSYDPTSSWYALRGTPEHPLIMLNGQNLNFDVQPYIKNGRTFLPYRALLEALGASSINWDAKRRTVTATLNGNRIELTIGYKVISRNGKSYLMDVAPEIRNNLTMIPVRFVSEGLGFKVDWDATNHVIYLNK